LHNADIYPARAPGNGMHLFHTFAKSVHSGKLLLSHACHGIKRQIFAQSTQTRLDSGTWQNLAGKKAFIRLNPEMVKMLRSFLKYLASA